MRKKGTVTNGTMLVEVERERSRGRSARKRMDDVNEWTWLSCLNGTWSELDDRAAWSKCVGRVALQRTGLCMGFTIQFKI